MALGDVYRLTLLGSFLGQAHENVLHYKVTAQAGFDPTGSQSVAAWVAAVQGDYLDIFSTAFTLNGFIWQRLLTSKNDPLYVAAAPSSDGTIAGDPTNSFDAAVISLRTGIPNRRHRGRIYIGGQAKANWVGNTMEAAYATALGTFFTTLVAPLNVAPGGGADYTLTLAVYSRLDNAAAVVTSGLLDDNPGTMRSRKAGVGV